MRKFGLLLTFILIGSFGFSQQTQKPDWKAGDTKQIVMTLSGKEINNGITTKDTTILSKSQLTVLEANGENYKIHFKTDNQLINSGRHFYPELSDKISENTDLSMHIKVYKDSLSSEILDTIGYNQALDASYEEILGILKTYTPERFDSAKIELDKLHSSLKEKSEATHLIDLLLDSYKVHYSEIDTVITTDSLPNPFNQTRFIGARVKTHVEKKSKNNYLIVAEKEYIIDVYKDLLSGLTDQLTSTMKKMSADEDNTNITDQMQEMYRTLIDSWEFEGYETFIIERNKTNWPVSLSKKTELHIQVPNKESKVLIEISIEIK